MNIIETNKKTIIAFGDLMSGAVFRYLDSIYIVTVDTDCGNAVALDNGEMCYFEDEREVETLPNAKLII